MKAAKVYTSQTPKQASNSLGIVSLSKSHRDVLTFLTYLKPNGSNMSKLYRQYKQHLSLSGPLNFLRELQLQKSVGYSQGYALSKHFPECLIKYLDREESFANTLMKCSKKSETNWLEHDMQIAISKCAVLHSKSPLSGYVQIFPMIF